MRRWGRRCSQGPDVLAPKKFPRTHAESLAVPATSEGLSLVPRDKRSRCAVQFRTVGHSSSSAGEWRCRSRARQARLAIVR